MQIDPKALTDQELTLCLDEMRRRGAAVVFYDPEEIMTMTDGWDGQPTLDQVKSWYDQDYLMDVMCEAIRREVDSLIESLPEADDPDYDNDGNLKPGVDN